MDVRRLAIETLMRPGVLDGFHPEGEPVDPLSSRQATAAIDLLIDLWTCKDGHWWPPLPPTRRGGDELVRPLARKADPQLRRTVDTCAAEAVGDGNPLAAWRPGR